MGFPSFSENSSVKSVMVLGLSLSLVASPIGISASWSDTDGVNLFDTAYTPVEEKAPKPIRYTTWEEGPSLMRYFSEGTPTETRALPTSTKPSTAQQISTRNEPKAKTIVVVKDETPQEPLNTPSAKTVSHTAHNKANNIEMSEVSKVSSPAPVAPSVTASPPTNKPPSPLPADNVVTVEPQSSPLRPLALDVDTAVEPQPAYSPLPPTEPKHTYQALPKQSIAQMPPYQWHHTTPNNVMSNEQATAMLFAQPSEPAGFDTLREPNLLESVISSTSTQVELTKNKALLLNLNMPISRATISNSEIAKAVVLSPTQIQLVGIELGSANLILWPSGGFNQQVIDISVHADLSAIRTQLKTINPSFNLTAASADQTMMLTGQTEHAEEAQLAKELTQGFFKASGTSTEAPNVMNLIQINGRPSTKLSLVQDKLAQIDPNIQLDMVPGPDGKDKAVLTGLVPSADVVSKAINTTSVFYGEPGLKVITGPGGNAVNAQPNESFHTGDAFSSNVAMNVLQGSIITDTSGNVVSMLRVAERPQVRCTIQFLEISRNDLNQLGSTMQGIAGNTGYGNLIGRQSSNRTFSTISAGSSAWSVAPADTQTNTSSLTQTLGDGATQVFTLGSQGSLYLSALVEKRQVRSLAEPTLTMLSGEKASFLAGGEVPIPVSVVNGQVSVQFKDFGIRLNLIPTVVEDDLIHLQVAPEVSTVDTTIFVNAGVLNIPGFRTRRMQTTLEMKNGEQLVLAGLYNTEDIRTITRTPVLGNVPILGAFFRSKSRDKDKNEMIVIIRPEIIRTAVHQPVDDGALTGTRRLLEDNLDASKAEHDENVSKHLLPYIQGKGN